MNRMLSIMALALGTAVIVVLASATLLQDRVSYEDEDVWTYDDYKTVNGASSASGSLEVVDGMIHAKSLGAGKYTDADGTHAVTVKKAQLDVLILIGQSNATYMGGYADTSIVSPEAKPGMAYYYGTSEAPARFENDKSVCSMWPMADPDGTQRIGGKWPSLAAAYSESTGHKVYMFSLAKGGESITSFDLDGYVWVRMKPMATSAMENIDTSLYDVHTMSYFWLQGEADVDMSVDEYKSRFMQMHNRLINGALGFDLQMCQIIKVRESRAPNPSEAQEQLAAEHPGTVRICTDVTDTFTQSNGLMADYSHYSQKGNNIVGSAAGTSAGEWTVEHFDSEEKVWRFIDLAPIVILAGILIMGFALISSRN